MLIADPSSVWVSHAAALVLAHNLATSTTIVPALVNAESGAYPLQASELLRTTVESRNGHIRFQAVVTDLSTQRNQQVIQVEQPVAGGFVLAANALAKQLDARATDFSTKSDRALQAFTGAVESANIQTRVQMLQQAIDADPGFGPAYIALLEVLAQSGQDPGPVLARAAREAGSFPAVDRARFTALRLRVLRAPLAKQEEAAREVLRLAPNDVETLAALGSIRFLAGDSRSGEQSLRRALESNPGNQNLQHQLAIGLLETRRFSDAEKVLSSLDSNPAVLPELATCILLEGDTRRADAVFGRYLALRPPTDPFATVFHASWLAISGRQKEAIDLLAGSSFSDPGLRSIALSQMSVWRLMTGDWKNAKQSAALASQIDRRPVSFAAIAALVSRSDESAGEWREQVQSSGLTEQAKQAVLGYGFFLAGRYPEAVQVWQQLSDQSGGADLRARTMLTASLERAGRRQEMEKLLVQPFVPELGDLYAAISFGQMHRLLGVRMR